MHGVLLFGIELIQPLVSRLAELGRSRDYITRIASAGNPPGYEPGENGEEYFLSGKINALVTLESGKQKEISIVSFVEAAAKYASADLIQRITTGEFTEEDCLTILKYTLYEDSEIHTTTINGVEYGDGFIAFLGEVLGVAVNIAGSYKPWWLKMQSMIHPDDDHLLKGRTPYEAFMSGDTRGLLITIDNEKLVTSLNHGVRAFIEFADLETVKRAQYGTLTLQDVDTLRQMAYFGKIRYEYRPDKYEEVSPDD